jgi:hypothetical protein
MLARHRLGGIDLIEQERGSELIDLLDLGRINGVVRCGFAECRGGNERRRGL